MPYKTQITVSWVEPELFLKHNNVSVYYHYADNDVDDPVRNFFTTTQETKETAILDDEKIFDLRRLKGYVHQFSQTISERINQEKTLIKCAIDRGDLF